LLAFMRAGDEINIEATELVAGGAAMARSARCNTSRAWFTSATARWDALRFS